MLFWRQEKETVISFVSSFPERILHNAPKVFYRLFSMTKCGCLLLKILRPFVPIQRKRRDDAFCSKCSHCLLPHKLPISTICLQLFLHVTFSCWLRTFQSRSVAWVWFSTGSSYTGSSGYGTVVGGSSGNVSNWIPSLANKAYFHCCVHLFHDRGRVLVGFSQKALLWRGVLRESIADCDKLCLLTVVLVNWATLVYLVVEIGQC